MAKLYILDTSVAGLILDGELWSREPERVVPYHKDLDAALAHTRSNMRLSDLTYSSSTVKRALDAWKWAEAIKQKDQRLVITPTVRAELMEAGQVGCKLHVYLNIHSRSNIPYQQLNECMREGGSAFPLIIKDNKSIIFSINYHR